jgi:hypothetical protein
MILHTRKIQNGQGVGQKRAIKKNTPILIISGYRMLMLGRFSIYDCIWVMN